MWRRNVITGLLLSLGVAACLPLAELREPQTSRPVLPPLDPHTGYARQGGHAGIQLYWNCVRPAPGVLRVEGVAHNPFLWEIRSLEFDLVGVNERARPVSQASGSAADAIIRTNQFSPFRVELRTAGSEVSFDLYYRYRGQEGLRSSLAALTVAELPRFAQAERRSFVRGACNAGPAPS